MKRMAIFHNLPCGGGMRMIENIIDRYKSTYNIELYVIGEKRPASIRGIKTFFFKVSPWRGFFLRNIWLFAILPYIHKHLAKTLNNNHNTIILTHDYFTKSPYLLRYLTIRRIYLCQEPQREFYESSEVHAPGLKQKIANFFRYPIKIVDETNVSKADAVLCNSRYSKKIVEKIYGKKCEIVFPGVDEKLFKPVKAKKEKMILCVGGINTVKDQLFLVKALNPLLDRYKLVLVGQGDSEYIKKIKETIDNNSNLKIFRHVTDKKLIDLYRAAMVTCISAHQEPFGLSSIESQSCGTPVVSVNEGGPAESIIEGKTGYLVARNELEFRTKVQQAIKNNIQMSIEARNNTVNNWSWGKTLKKVDKFLR